MDKVNKQELRRLAEAVQKEGDWYTAETISSFPDQWPDEHYVLNLGPDTILSLLDELEEKDRALDLWSQKAQRISDELEQYRKDAERYRWLCEKFGVTTLPCAMERILSGDIYVADGKASVDAVIDAELAKEGGANG